MIINAIATTFARAYSLFWGAVHTASLLWRFRGRIIKTLRTAENLTAHTAMCMPVARYKALARFDQGMFDRLNALMMAVVGYRP